MSKISIIIPTTLGGFVHIAGLLPSIGKEAETRDAEIIIVDNASRDNTLAYIGTQNPFNVKIIVNKLNEGYAKGNNQGARIAEGEYLLFLNNDTVAEPGLLYHMLETFDRSEDVGVVGCRIMNDGGKLQHIGVCFTQGYVPYELGSEVPEISPAISNDDKRIYDTRPVPSVTGACLMIKRSVFDDVGGWNEQFINGWEDTDLVLRVREKGYSVWYSGTAGIRHKKHGSINAGRFRFEAQNRKLYDDIWVHTGRAKDVLKGFIQG